MCRVKPQCEGIIRYQKTMRVHEARAKHKPDLLSPMGFLHKPKINAKIRVGGSTLFMNCTMKSERPLMGQRKYYMLYCALDIHYKISKRFFYNIRI